jgi:hypothetical protein
MSARTDLAPNIVVNANRRTTVGSEFELRRRDGTVSPDRDCSQHHALEIVMKRFIVCTAVLGLVFSSAAQAKGCIKGAIVGGVAGSVAGHGKVGAAAGCVIGHHEANKADAEKAKAQTPASSSKGDGKI